MRKPKKKTMSDEELALFINGLSRAEIEQAIKTGNRTYINAYIKAVEVTLWSAGYDEDWLSRGNLMRLLRGTYDPDGYPEYVDEARDFIHRALVNTVLIL